MSVVNGEVNEHYPCSNAQPISVVQKIYFHARICLTIVHEILNEPPTIVVGENPRIPPTVKLLFREVNPPGK